MSRRGPRKPPIDPAEATDPHGLAAWMLGYLEALRVRNFSEVTVEVVGQNLDWFLRWSRERGLTRPGEITRPMLLQYQRHLYHRRKTNGEPLSFRSQHGRLRAVLAYFKWLTRQNVIPSNPASEVELPRLEKRLPKYILTIAEAEVLLAVPDLGDPFGIRDRAILETFYSTGMRRSELARLQIFDLDADRGTVTIRQGKGKRDRMIPIGERAVAWIRKYLGEVRPGLAVVPGENTLFLNYIGEAFTPDRLTQMVGRYLAQSGVGKKGACHLLRHTCATLMLEGGADIRFIQEQLGHRELSTTQIYTKVAIKTLKAIHTATHPGARLTRPEDDLDGGNESAEGQGWPLGTGGSPLPPVGPGASSGEAPSDDAPPLDEEAAEEALDEAAELAVLADPPGDEGSG